MKTKQLKQYCTQLINEFFAKNKEREKCGFNSFEHLKLRAETFALGTQISYLLFQDTDHSIEECLKTLENL